MGTDAVQNSGPHLGLRYRWLGVLTLKWRTKWSASMPTRGGGKGRRRVRSSAVAKSPKLWTTQGLTGEAHWSRQRWPLCHLDANIPSLTRQFVQNAEDSVWHRALSFHSFIHWLTGYLVDGWIDSFTQQTRKGHLLCARRWAGSEDKQQAL